MGPGTSRAPVLVAALMLLVACAPASHPGDAQTAVTPTEGSTRAAAAPPPPPVNARFDYQLGGGYAPADSVRIVDRDRSERPAPGRYTICYVNAFQTQPGEKAFWVEHHADLLLHRHGKLVSDPDWPGEYLLDTSSAGNRAALLDIVGPWLDGCATDGFAAVEPDNLDSWTRSHRLLTRADNVAFATQLAQRAHAAGLAIAQKNTDQLGTRGRDAVGFDFAVVEECQVYRECGGYRRVWGRNMIEIEYTDNGRRAYARACRARGRSISVILRDRDVVPRGHRGYVYRSC